MCSRDAQMQVMTLQKTAIPPRFQDGLPERLADAGVSAAATQALLALDQDMFLWHRMAMKGEIAGRLIADMGLGLELSHFYALTAITRIEGGIGRDAPQPATVGLLAEEMALDPSRASRIAADLIASGFVRREAVQADGRKSVLVLTDKAVTAFGEFRDRKWDKWLTVFRDWPDDDVARFSQLFGQYCADMRRAFGTSV